ncbi:2870_t:CDS:2 [Entrophospora sp. SA101]|nr:2870_t:CDS:2 [Entrophospora sp. SA101]
MDNNLRFWDSRSGKDIKEITDIHMGQITSVSVSPVPVYGVSWNPLGGQVYSADKERIVCIWSNGFL